MHPKKQYAAILQISVEDVNISKWKKKISYNFGEFHRVSYDWKNYNSCFNVEILVFNLKMISTCNSIISSASRGLGSHTGLR